MGEALVWTKKLVELAETANCLSQRCMTFTMLSVLASQLVSFVFPEG